MSEAGRAGADCALDPETAQAVERALGGAAASLRPVRDRVLARLDSVPRPRRTREDERRLRPFPFLGRKRTLFLMVNALAAVLLVTVYAGYLGILRAQRQAFAMETRTDVRNLAIVLRMLHERGAPRGDPATLAVALTRLRLERDPFGNPFALEATRVWSFGANGRDERGAGDDIVAYIR